MTGQATEKDHGTKLAPGEIVAIETQSGTRHVQVTHVRSPYPDVVRAICPNGNRRALEDIANGRTAFAAMVELSRSLEKNLNIMSVIGKASIPTACREYPTFRVPIRNKTGEIIYWWTWDGEGLAIAPPATNAAMPLREIIPIETLRARISDLKG